MSVNRNQYQSDSSLLEIIVAAFLLSTVIVALVSLTTVSVARNRSAKERVAATRLAQEVSEWLRFERDRQGFTAFYLHVKDQTEPFWLTQIPDPEDEPNGELLTTVCTTSESECRIDRKFLRQVTIQATGDVSVAYTVTVTWPRNATTNDTVTIKGVLEKWSE